MAFRANALVLLAALLGADGKAVKAVAFRGAAFTGTEKNETVVANTSGALPDELLPEAGKLGLNDTKVYHSAPWHEALKRSANRPNLPTINQILMKLDAINDTLDQVDSLVVDLNNSVNDLVGEVVGGANKTMETLHQIRDAAAEAAFFGDEEISSFISTFTLYMTLQVEHLQAMMVTMVQQQIYDRLDLVHTKFGEVKELVLVKFQDTIETVRDMVVAAADRLPSASSASFLQQHNNKPKVSVASVEMATARLEELNTTVTTISNLLEGLNLTAVDMVLGGVVGGAKTNLEAIDSQCYGAVESAGGAVPDAVKPMMKILCSAPLKLLDTMQPKIEKVIRMVDTKVNEAIVALAPLREAIDGLAELVNVSQFVP